MGGLKCCRAATHVYDPPDKSSFSRPSKKRAGVTINNGVFESQFRNTEESSLMNSLDPFANGANIDKDDLLQLQSQIEIKSAITDPRTSVLNRDRASDMKPTPIKMVTSENFMFTNEKEITS